VGTGQTAKRKKKKEKRARIKNVTRIRSSANCAFTVHFTAKPTKPNMYTKFATKVALFLS
jgi:hypothetical protein